MIPKLYIDSDPLIFDVAAKQHQNMRNIDNKESFRKFMDLMRTYDEFGSCAFKIEPQVSDLPNSCLMLVNQRGIFVMHECEILLKILYESISNCIPNDDILLVSTGNSVHGMFVIKTYF